MSCPSRARSRHVWVYNGGGVFNKCCVVPPSRCFGEEPDDARLSKLGYESCSRGFCCWEPDSDDFSDEEDEDAEEEEPYEAYRADGGGTSRTAGGALGAFDVGASSPEKTRYWGLPSPSPATPSRISGFSPALLVGKLDRLLERVEEVAQKSDESSSLESSVGETETPPVPGLVSMLAVAASENGGIATTAELQAVPTWRSWLSGGDWCSVHGIRALSIREEEETVMAGRLEGNYSHFAEGGGCEESYTSIRVHVTTLVSTLIANLKRLSAYLGELTVGY